MRKHIRHAGWRARRGFTLIEVLMATFVIALGVLGLLALFAGAARQQQVSSNETAAVFATRSAVGALEAGFGALRFPAGAQNPFPMGVWIPLPMNPDPDQLYLSVNPNGGANGAYFLVRSSGNVPLRLYENEVYAQNLQAPNTVADFPGQTPQVGFANATPTGLFDTPAGRWTYTLLDRRIDPDSIEFQVQISRLGPDVDGDGDPDRVPTLLSFGRAQSIEYASDQNSEGSGLWVVPQNGDACEDPVDGGDPTNPNDCLLQPALEERNFIIVDVQPNELGFQAARIQEVQIGAIQTMGNPDPESARVDFIDITRYQWRNSQLISLNDRIRYRSDPDAPQGRRADQCYSVLYRRTPNGPQAMVVAYQLSAPSSSAVYIPPDAPEDSPLPTGRNVGPIRRVSLYLHRDQDDPQQQYFRVSNPVDLWAIAPGQLLLLAQGDAPNSPGSDKAVKVIRQVRETTEQGNQWRGYVDRMPRIYDQPAIPAGTAGGRLFQHVYAVADTVISREDGSTWKLTPLVASEFQVESN